MADQRRSATQSGARRHPALIEVETWLVRRYRVRFSGVVLSEYRHAREGLGFHRDRAMTWLDDTLVALLSLGAQRPWLLRPDNGRPVIDPDDALRDAIDLAPANGDLLVMGGRCQRTWLHAVPTVATPVHQPHLGPVAVDVSSRRARHRPHVPRPSLLLPPGTRLTLAPPAVRRTGRWGRPGCWPPAARAPDTDASYVGSSTRSGCMPFTWPMNGG